MIKIKAFTYLIGQFLILTTSYAQEIVHYDKNKVSKETELNIAFTGKRGIESKKGIIYYVEEDKKTLTAYSRGEIKWKTNIIATCGEPEVGKPEIRYFKLEKGIIKVIFGKHNFAEIDIRDGKTECAGSD